MISKKKKKKKKYGQWCINEGQPPRPSESPNIGVTILTTSSTEVVQPFTQKLNTSLFIVYSDRYIVACLVLAI